MEVSKDALKNVGVLTEDDRPQLLVPSNELSDQSAICSELFISSVVFFIRDGRWSGCIKYLNRYYFSPWISNYVN